MTTVGTACAGVLAVLFGFGSIAFCASAAAQPAALREAADAAYPAYT